MIAGLVALKGPKHGGAGVLAAQLVRTLVDGDVAPVIRERVALGEQAIDCVVGDHAAERMARQHGLCDLFIGKVAEIVSGDAAESGRNGGHQRIPVSFRRLRERHRHKKNVSRN